MECGRTVGTPRRHETIINKIDVPLFDEELIEEVWRIEQAKREEEDKKWWDWYNEYLKSPEWAAKRAAVFGREWGQCQGCQQATATQVHHLTYKHVGDELLFELIALCDKCHERAHLERVK